MRQVFLESPWIHPEEPERLRALFTTYGQRKSVKAGTALPHGTHGAYVGLLLKGLGAFRFTDAGGRSHIFAVILPGRVFGDLDALTRSRLNLQGLVIRNSEVALLTRSRWEDLIDADPGLLKLYTKHAIAKQEAHMEGMIANFTMSLPARLRALLRSLISSCYPVKPDDWNPLPVKLTVTEMSEVVAANRSSVSLQLSAWIDEGLIRRDGRMLIVHGKLLTDIYDWQTGVAPDDPAVSDPPLFLED